MKTFHSTLLFLLPLIIYVTGQAEINTNPHNHRRVKPPTSHGRHSLSKSTAGIGITETSVVTATQPQTDVTIQPPADIEIPIDADIEVLDENDTQQPTQSPVDERQTPVGDITQSPIVAYIQSTVDAVAETTQAPVENPTQPPEDPSTWLSTDTTPQLQEFSIPQEVTQLDVDSQSSIAPTVEIEAVSVSQAPVAFDVKDITVDTLSSPLPPNQLLEKESATSTLQPEQKSVSDAEEEEVTHPETTSAPKPAINTSHRRHHSRIRKPKVSPAAVLGSKLKSAHAKPQTGVFKSPAPEIQKSSTQRVTTDSTVILKKIAPKHRHRPSKLDSACQQGDGYYSVKNECDSYIKCEDNEATKVWCPDGLHFNSASKPPSYPCAYPSAVKCTNGIERDPSPTDECPRQYGIFATKDGDCSKYVICQKGTATIMPCPAGLVFNPTLENCDYLEKVPQCNPNVFKDFTCPVPPIVDDNFVFDIVNTYKYKPDCKLYIACQKGYPRLLSCESGLAYDEESESCIAEEYVADCDTPYAEN